MNILCATDNKYVPYCGVMLTSLFESNKDEKFDVFIIVESLSMESREQFDLLAKTYGQQIQICQVDTTYFANCPFNPQTDHVSLAAYFRLAVAEILPSNLDRILYLDCDIVVVNRIREFYHENLDDYACGVIKDEAAVLDIHYDRLGVDYAENNPYINSGVLLINLDYWRRNKVMEKCMNFISQNKENLAFHDQDTIYMVLKNKFKYVHYRYNLQRELLTISRFNELPIKEQNEVLEAVNNPVIIHFTGAFKPWSKISTHPFTNKWLEFNNISIWKDRTIIINNFVLKATLLAYRNEIIWRLGLKPRPKTYII